MIFIIFIVLFQLESSLSQQCYRIQRSPKITFSCTNEYNRNSICTFRCIDGYQLAQASSRARACRCFGARCLWTGTQGFCLRSRSTTTTATTTTTTTTTTSPVLTTLPSTATASATLPSSVEEASNVSTIKYACPTPYFSKQNFARIIDKWPTGIALRVRIKKNNLKSSDGWSVIMKFSENLPSNISVLSWSSKLVSAKGKHLVLSSQEFNANITDTDRLVFIVVLVGDSKQKMPNDSISVGFYNEAVENFSCYNLSRKLMNETMMTSPINNATSVTTLSTAVQTTTRTTTSATTSTASTKSTTTTTKPTRPSTTRRTTTMRPSTTTRSLVTTSSRIASGLEVDHVRINDAAVQRHRQGCNVLLNSLSVKFPSYPSPGSSETFRFNAHVVISGDGNRLNDWTLKIVFSKPIINIQLWEAKNEGNSRNGRVFIIGPHSWNSQLRNDYSFQIIPEMSSSSIPKTVMYLCPKGITPNFNSNGIFEALPERSSTTQHSTTTSQPTTKQTRRSTTTRPRVITPRPTPTTTSEQTSRRPAHDRARCSRPPGRRPRRSRQTRVRFRPSPPNERRPYDYNQILALSVLFYDAQRSGKLPNNFRIPWRGDSGLRDGCDVGHDLTGGLYDAGDHVKFGFPLAWTITTLAWGVIEFKEAYVAAREFTNMLNLLKWVTDYFIKAHTSKYEFYGQVGNGRIDHRSWGRPEDMRMLRPSYKIDKTHPGTELAAETAAALAATSVVFRESNPSYANLLIRHAKDLYEFGDRYRGSYHQSIRDAFLYYRSYGGYQDELVWGALWLYKATGERKYLQDAERKYRASGGGGIARVFSWDDKRAGSQVLLANFTGQQHYKNSVAAYQRFLRRAPKTPRGMTWLDQWGSNRYAANGAFIALSASKIQGMPQKEEYIRYARTQINLLLGGAGRSYVVGFGINPPASPHHRSSSCRAPPAPCNWDNAFHTKTRNPYVLHGALIAGPYLNGSFVDDRTNYITNEVALDYNAGFQGAVAGLKYYQIKNRS